MSAWASLNTILTNALPSTAAYAFFSPDGRSAFGNPIGTLAVPSSLNNDASGPNAESKKVYHLDFNNNKNIFQNKKTSELLFQYMILKMCSIGLLVDHGPAMLRTLEKVHLSAPAYWFIKNTFFKHFCAGENIDEAVTAAKKLREQGVRTILDYSVEADEEGSHNFDQVVDVLVKTMVASAENPDAISYSCFKMTGLTNPTLLEKMTKTISFMEEETKKGNKVERPLWYTELLNYKDYNQFMNKIKNQPTVPKNTSDMLYTLDETEFNQLSDLLSRLDRLMTVASKHKVPVLIDAEQTYYQKAIDFFALSLSKRYNTQDPIVYNTYQLYLKDGLTRLQRDMKQADSDKWYFAAKLVRGAYMDSERARAKQLSYNDPINETINATHNNYNQAISTIVDAMAKKKRVAALVASHNENSVDWAWTNLQNSGFTTPEGKLRTDPEPAIHFAQLYGMSDHISLTLAQQKLHVAKYVPFGPVRAVMPYLIRRMQENRGFMGKTGHERELIGRELKRRILRRDN
jgi:proline dehydrogenase